MVSVSRRQASQNTLINVHFIWTGISSGTCPLLIAVVLRWNFLYTIMCLDTGNRTGDAVRKDCGLFTGEALWEEVFAVSHCSDTGFWEYNLSVISHNLHIYLTAKLKL